MLNVQCSFSNRFTLSFSGSPLCIFDDHEKVNGITIRRTQVYVPTLCSFFLPPFKCSRTLCSRSNFSLLFYYTMYSWCSFILFCVYAFVSVTGRNDYFAYIHESEGIEKTNARVYSHTSTLSHPNDKENDFLLFLCSMICAIAVAAFWKGRIETLLQCITQSVLLNHMGTVRRRVWNRWHFKLWLTALSSRMS